MRLVLLRHAKSDWPANITDLERPLATRGINDCVYVADFFNAKHWQIAQAIVSPAERTQETFKRVQQSLDYQVHSETDSRIYEASVASLLEVVNELSAETAILVGHGPGLPGLAVTLADDSSHENVHLIRLKFPTAAIAVLESELPWSEWRSHTARLVEFKTPKDSN
jgi:phosphohistidine phosphatase